MPGHEMSFSVTFLANSYAGFANVHCYVLPSLKKKHRLSRFLITIVHKISKLSQVWEVIFSSFDKTCRIWNLFI